jgi:hypothetical protein
VSACGRHDPNGPRRRMLHVWCTRRRYEAGARTADDSEPLITLGIRLERATGIEPAFSAWEPSQAWISDQA